MSVDRKYYIEFVGAHGAGKTYTYHEITKKQLLKPYKSFFPGQVNRPKLHFAFNCPSIVLKNLKHILFVISFFYKYSKTKLLNFKVCRVLIKMIILHTYYYRYDFNIFLKDDMLHMIQRIIFKNDVDVDEVFDQFFSHFSYLYDGLIFVDISTKKMEERFKKRFPGKSENFKKSRKKIHERVKKQSANLRKIITLQNIVPYLIVNGNDDVNKNAQKIITFIKNEIILKKETC